MQEENNIQEIVIYKVCNEKAYPYWPVYVTKIILELLANGMRPSTYIDNIAIHAKSLGTRVVIREFLSKSYGRRSRGILRITLEICSTIRLGKSPLWKQLYTNYILRY